VKGASGAEIDLPQLNKIREMAVHREFDTLVVRELDRLSRNLGKQLVVEEELKRHGVTIEYVLYDYPNTPEGALMKNIRGALSEYEREKITERIVRGRRLAVKGGSILCYGRAAYGYRLNKVEKTYLLMVHEPEAKIVRLIFSWWVFERFSLSEIVRRLNAMGVPMHEKPLGVKGEREWTHTTVRVILKNETYAGTWHFGKRNKHGKKLPREQWVSVQVPAIVSRADFDLAQTLLDENASRRAHCAKHDYLMARRVTCGKCNHLMAAQTAYDKHKEKKYSFSYYICRHLRGKGKIHRVSGRQVDTAIWQWLKELLLSPERLRDNMVAYLRQQDEVIAPLRRQLDLSNELLTQKKREYDELVDLYLTSKVRKDVLDVKAEALDAEIASLDRTQRELAARLDAATLTQERVAGLEQFAVEIRKRLDYADSDFAKRRWLVETLNVTAILREEEGEKMLDAECIVGETALRLTKTTTRPSAWRGFHQPTACPRRFSSARGAA
jgi:site-specific DNA recombinase